MAGGRFEVALVPQEDPQSYGAETVEFLVAGHAGSTPRPLAKVASGGELSRLALASAVTSAQSAGAASAAGAAPDGAAQPGVASTVTAHAGVGTLIFTHEVPGPRNFLTRRMFLAGVDGVFPGTVVLGEDGMRFSLPPKS